jgi:hypothetical protein
MLMATVAKREASIRVPFCIAKSEMSAPWAALGI